MGLLQASSLRGGLSLPSTALLLAATQSLSELVLCSELSKALMLWIGLASEFVESIQQISISDSPQSWLCRSASVGEAGSHFCGPLLSYF